MNGLTAGVLSAGIAIGLGAGVAQAQKWTGSVPLGDIARQLKAQRAKSAKKPRMFTNDDLIALRPASELPSPSDRAAAPADDRTNPESGANLAGKNEAIPVEWGKATLGEDYIDRMSKVQVVSEAPGSSATKQQASVQVTQGTESEPTAGWAKAKFRVSAETAQATGKATEHPNPSHAAPAREDEVSAPYGEWAKAKFRAAQGARSTNGEPGPISASTINSPAAPRQDLGYVERSDGKVEAIVAEGEHIGLIEETKEFMRDFHIPAPSPAELEVALAPPPPNPPEAAAPEADQQAQAAPAADANSSATENQTAVAQLQPPQAPPAGSAQSQPEASLEAEPLADYAGDLSRSKPPENLQPANPPAFVTAAPDVIANRSSVTPIGYVEKAGGEKEAIVDFQDQVFLVHEGDLFAGKYRVLQVTALSVEIVEEPTEASSAAIDRRRNTQVPRIPK